MALSVSIELVSSSARVTSVKSYKRLLVCDGGTSGPKDRTPGLPGSDKNDEDDDEDEDDLEDDLDPGP